MRKKTNVLLLGAIAALAGAAMTGCGSGGGETYTYVEALSSSPDMWNVHSWKENTESIIFGYTEMGLYDFTLGENNQGYTIVPEMADGEPVDDSANVTAEEVEEYGMDQATDSAGVVKSGVKWLINLNQKACWEDGTVINADTYLDSMDRLLDPAMANFRADSWYSGNVVLGNAEARFKSGRTIYESLVDGDGNIASHTGTAIDSKRYASLYTVSPWVNGWSISKWLSYFGADGLPLTAALAADEATWGTSSSPKYVALDDNADAKAKFTAVCKEIVTTAYGLTLVETDRVDNDQDNIYLMDFLLGAYASKETAFSEVGIKKVSDYQIALYLVRPASLFYLKEQLSGNWIVKTDLYDANKTTAGSLVSTTYATSLATYMSYGPYKLTNFTADKEVVVEKNDKWYGYTDGKHTDQYSIDKFDMQVVENLDTQLLMFEKGQLDSIGLRSQDMAKYSTSPYLMYTPQSYTDKIALNSSFSKLKERQVEQSATDKVSINKTILANVKFRQALSWALDRTSFVQTETAGSTPALGVINDMYVADVDTGILYRDTDAGKRVVSDIYGDSKDGFNISKAKQLITEACTEEAASDKDGHYTSGDKVSLSFVVYNKDWETAIQNHIDDFVAATVGTPLENKFEVKIDITENNQDEIKAGNAELCMDIWGGAQMNPYGIPDTWIDADNRTCFGYSPDSETIDIDMNGDGSIDKATERRSNTAWYTALNDGEYSAANADYLVRSKILSYLEEYMLSNQYFITVRARNSVGLDSFRVQEGTDTYQALVGYGGIRAMKLTQSDQAWATKAAAGLDYTK